MPALDGLVLVAVLELIVCNVISPFIEDDPNSSQPSQAALLLQCYSDIPHLTDIRIEPRWGCNVGVYIKKSEFEEDIIMTLDQTPSAKADLDEQDLTALIKVQEEFTLLTAGNPKKMSVEEAFNIREYARKRTDLNKSEENLTPEQRAWKVLFKSLDEQLTKTIGDVKKDKLDNLLFQFDQLKSFEQNVKDLISLGRQIEELLIHQGAYLEVHFGGGNRYRDNEKILAAEMLAESTPNQRRIEIARDILGMVDKYKNLVVESLHHDQDKIYELLIKLSSVYKQIFFIRETEEDEFKQVESLCGEWLSLTKEVHNERLKVIIAVKNLVEADTLIPLHIIKNDGDAKLNISSEEFTPRLAVGKLLVEEAYSKEQVINEKRTPISIKAFGEPDSYIKAKKEEAPNELKKENIKSNPLTKVINRFLKAIVGTVW